MSSSPDHELKPGLCPSLAANPGERSSPVPFFFFSFCFRAPPRASSMTDLGRQLRCRTRRETRLAHSWCPMGLSSPYCAPPGSSGTKPGFLIRREKSEDFSLPSAADHPSQLKQVEYFFEIRQQQSRKNKKTKGCKMTSHFWGNLKKVFGASEAKKCIEMAPRHPVSVWKIWKFTPFFLYGNSFVFDTYATQKPDAILSRPGDPHTSICQILIQIFAAGDPALFFFSFLFFFKKVQFLISGMQRSSVRISAVFRNGREGKKGWRQEFFIFQNLVLSSLFFWVTVSNFGN